MTMITWVEQLAIGVPIIDQGHQTIIDFINRLDDQRDQIPPCPVGADLLRQLMDALGPQFMQEEQLMESVGFPHLDSVEDSHSRETERTIRARMSALQAVVYVNGTISLAADAVVPVFDHGFLYGEGVYETLRTYRRVPFLFEPHMERLRRSAGLMALDVPFSDAHMERWVAETMTVTGSPLCLPNFGSPS